MPSEVNLSEKLANVDKKKSNKKSNSNKQIAEDEYKSKKSHSYSQVIDE